MKTFKVLLATLFLSVFVGGCSFSYHDHGRDWRGWHDHWDYHEWHHGWDHDWHHH